jgi:DinB superfamily
MAPQEQSEIVKCLEDSRADFRAAAEGVSEEQAKVRPEPGRWSVLECVEHIVVAESRFLGWVQNPVTEPAPPMDKEKEAKLLLGVSGRSQRANAPEPVHPTGRFSTLAEALAQFDAARANSIQFAESRGAGLYSLATKHPAFGAVNGAEVMVLIAAHARRHAAQIREIRAAL